MTSTRNRRRTLLIQPKLQLWLIGSFAGISALSLLAQFVLLAYRLTDTASRMSAGGAELSERTPSLLLFALAGSFAVMLPATLLIGMRLTHHVAGPLYRMERHLGEIREGGSPEPLQLREDDQFQDLCQLLNEAFEVARDSAREERRDAA